MPLSLPIDAFLTAPGALVDVRSPGEFLQGHIPGAQNLPLFDDDERAAVGTTYKRQGRAAAIQLGLELVGPRLSTLASGLQNRGPGGPLRLHCWRGGLRSESVAWLAQLQERQVVVLAGGYQAFRRWVLAQFERPWPLRLLGGRTGTGKTDVLQALQRLGVAVVDLEGLAQHRGSSFGGLGMPQQPTSEHFENLLALTLTSVTTASEIWVEAESAQVGRCRIPAALWRTMQAAPVLEIRRPLGERIEQLVAVYGAQDPEALAEATNRIARRLGPQRTAAALAAIAARHWPAACAAMLDYYDRCYDHELKQRAAAAQPNGRGVTAVDLTGLDPTTAAKQLLRSGLVQGTA